jgi:hypothetical protein
MAIFTIDLRKEQPVCIKFCDNLGKCGTETLTVIQPAFADQSLSRAQVFQWNVRFKTGRTSVDDDERSDCMGTCKDVTPNFGKNRPGRFTMTTP